MKTFKITVKTMALALLCASAMTLVGCGSSMGVSQPAKKQAATTTTKTSTSTRAAATNAGATNAGATNAGATTTLSTEKSTNVGTTTNADGSTSKGRKAANK